MVTKETELQHLKDKRERLYLQPDSLENKATKVEIDILTERIWEILNERKRSVLCYQHTY